MKVKIKIPNFNYSEQSSLTFSIAKWDSEKGTFTGDEDAVGLLNYITEQSYGITYGAYGNPANEKIVKKPRNDPEDFVAVLRHWGINVPDELLVYDWGYEAIECRYSDFELEKMTGGVIMR